MIQAMSYEPVMSEYSDVLYDPRTDAQASCLKEIDTCDILVLVVGSRFGSKASVRALDLVDLDEVRKLGRDNTFLSDSSSLSVTQVELIRAVQIGVPVFAFVEQAVLHDYNTYLANRDEAFHSQMRFGSVSQPEHAQYLFTFIEFLDGLQVNNAIEPFSKIDDIESHLGRQWASLFQRMLRESREIARTTREYERIIEKLNDLQAAVVSTADEGQAREVAQGTISFRHVVADLATLPVDLRAAISEAISWGELVTRAGIVRFLAGPDERLTFGPRLFAELKDGSLLEARARFSQLARYEADWKSLTDLPSSVRIAIVEVVSNDRRGTGGFKPSVRYELNRFDEIVERDRKPLVDPVYDDEEPF
jgi:Domain of unknown function (DUF4062)